MSSTDLVTILSTDWVNSTATRSALGEDRADRLQHRHDAMLRDAIEGNGGTVVKNSGDGALATFRSATDALAAAVSIQNRFAAHSQGAPADEAISLRVGVSAGDVLHRDDDIFGSPVIEAVRLQDTASPGQIVCSELVRMLGRGRGGFEFELIGLLELKGLPEPVAACAVVWAPTEVSTTLPLPPELQAGMGTPFVGRHPELHLATECALNAEQTQSVWVLGEPGIGKTRLAAEVAARAHAAGAFVLYGRCDEQVRAPFRPVIDGLRWFVSQQRDDELQARLGADPDPLVRLVPELHGRVPGLSVPGLATDVEQYRLFEAVRSWLGTIAAERPVMFVVDDAHWADQPTLALLGHVARSAQAAQLTIVATARDTDPDVNAELADLVDELERTGRSTRLELRGLEVSAIGALLERSDLSSLTAERLADETAGNPLFLEAVLAAVDAERDLPSELPADVRTAVRRRVGRLDRGTEEFLQVAALFGLDFSLDVVAAAAGLDDREGLARVEQALSARLVEEMGFDRFRFTHALVRDALEADLSATRRARIHAAIAAVIEQRYASQLDDHLRALAHHYANAGSVAARERAVEYARQAGVRATELLAFAAAAEDYTFALELLDELPEVSPRTRYDLLFALGRALLLSGQNNAALITTRAAADVAREHLDASCFVKAALEFEETSWRPGVLGHEAVVLLREAAALDLTPDMRVRVEASLGRALHYSGYEEQARAVVEAVLPAARALGDVEVFSHAMLASIQNLSRQRAHECRLIIERAREVDAIGDQLEPLDNSACGAAQYASVAALCLGDRDGADGWLAKFHDYAERSGTRFNSYVVVCDDQVRAFADADLERAEALAVAAVELGRQLGEEVEGVHGVKMFLLRREQDRLGELAPLVQLLVKSNPASAMWAPGLVMLLTEVGLHDDARPLLLDLARDDFAALPRDMLFTGALCMMSESAFKLGIAEIAPSIDAELEGWNDVGVSMGHTVAFIGAVSRYRAFLAWLVGDLDLAEARFAYALDFHRRVRSPLWEAHTLANWSRLKRERDEIGAARDLAEGARAIAESHGLAAVLRDLEHVGSF